MGNLKRIASKSSGTSRTSAAAIEVTVSMCRAGTKARVGKACRWHCLVHLPMSHHIPADGEDETRCSRTVFSRISSLPRSSNRNCLKKIPQRLERAIRMRPTGWCRCHWKRRQRISMGDVGEGQSVIDKSTTVVVDRNLLVLGIREAMSEKRCRESGSGKE